MCVLFPVDLTYLADTSPQEEIRRSARGALWVLNSVPIGRPAGITRQSRFKHKFGSSCSW